MLQKWQRAILSTVGFLTEYCRVRHHSFQIHIHPKLVLLGQNPIFNGISAEKNLQDSFKNQQFKIICCKHLLHTY